MIRTCPLIAMLISSALIDLARGGDLVECEPQRVTGDGRHWAYRIVDGRECWYPGRPGKPKNELFWDRGITPSARQRVDQPAAETEPSEPPSRFVSAPPEQPETTKAMPQQWHASAADQLLAFTCCWPELEEPAPLPQLTPQEGQPPAWPLALLPLGLYALWRVAKPRRAGDARVHRRNGCDGVRDRSAIEAMVRERPINADDDRDQSATSLFVIPIDEQQHVAMASLPNAPDAMPLDQSSAVGSLAHHHRVSAVRVRS
jgi:hypothetical protein